VANLAPRSGHKSERVDRSKLDTRNPLDIHEDLDVPEYLHEQKPLLTHFGLNADLLHDILHLFIRTDLHDPEEAVAQIAGKLSQNDAWTEAAKENLTNKEALQLEALERNDVLRLFSTLRESQNMENTQGTPEWLSPGQLVKLIDYMWKQADIDAQAKDNATLSVFSYIITECFNMVRNESSVSAFDAEAYVSSRAENHNLSSAAYGAFCGQVDKWEKYLLPILQILQFQSFAERFKQWSTTSKTKAGANKTVQSLSEEQKVLNVLLGSTKGSLENLVLDPRREKNDNFDLPDRHIAPTLQSIRNGAFISFFNYSRGDKQYWYNARAPQNQKDMQVFRYLRDYLTDVQKLSNEELLSRLPNFDNQDFHMSVRAELCTAFKRWKTWPLQISLPWLDDMLLYIIFLMIVRRCLEPRLSKPKLPVALGAPARLRRAT